MRHHDLVVLGSGSGNTILDERFADRDVALVEHGVFGGTCLNVGCIPTKMYVYAADVAQAVRHASRYGVDASIDKVRWTDIRDRVFGRIDPISAGGREYRIGERSPNITVYEGHARFTGTRELAVSRTDGSGSDTISADQVVIATGSRPMIPDVVAQAGVPYETSDTVMRLDALPARIIILGGGFIGCEFAHVFSALGAQVSVIARSSLLRHHDETICARFTEAVRRDWDLHLGHSIERVGSTADGIAVELSGGGTVTGDLLLVATGRLPNGDLLDLDRTGVPVDGDGYVVVDDQQRTPVAGIFALGDVSSPYQLKHVANHEAKVVAHNLLHPEAPRRSDHRFVPSAVFSDPQIATVGRTEAECREAGLDHVTAVQEYADVAYGWAMEDTVGLCKVIAERGTGRLLGAHVLGAQASTVIQPLIQAMSFGLSARDMAAGQYWIHPALPEVVENALLKLAVGD